MTKKINFQEAFKLFTRKKLTLFRYQTITLSRHHTPSHTHTQSHTTLSPLTHHTGTTLTVHGFVGTVVHVRRVGRKRPIGSPRYAGETLRFREDAIHFQELLALFGRLVRPRPRYHVISDVAGGGGEIERDGRKLSRSTTLEKEHMMGVGDVPVWSVRCVGCGV